MSQTTLQKCQMLCLVSCKSAVCQQTPIMDWLLNDLYIDIFAENSLMEFLRSKTAWFFYPT
jgi:hypothetical protein